MKLAIIGSRGLWVDVAPYLPPGVTEILSGGARGIDRCAEACARRLGLPLRVFLPDYEHYGRGATHRRNRQMAEACDSLLAIWDGQSRGTQSTIQHARRLGRPVRVVLLSPDSQDGGCAATHDF